MKQGRPKNNESSWVATPEILEFLGVSRWHLYNIRDSFLKRGKHYKNINKKDIKKGTTGRKAIYRWHLPRIEKLLEGSPGNE
jgi:Zn-finger domain-containing protein